MRCALARRGWRVSHLVSPEEYAQKPLAPTLLTHH